MIDLDWRVHETEGIALVAAVVESAAPTPRLVVVDPRVDGAVLPPRRRGLPERGWSDEGFAAVVPAGDRLALGFASRGELEDPPVAVLDEGRASLDGATAAGTDDPTPTEVLRDLGSPVPPRDAVPEDHTVSGSSLSPPTDSSPADRTGSTIGEQLAPPAEESAPPAEESAPSHEQRPQQPGDQRSEAPPDRVTATEQPDTAEPDCHETREIPGPVADWLDDVATRADRAERLAAGRALDEAATAVAAAGGLAGVEQLVDALGADQAALRAVADRATELAADCERREDVPVDAYRELS